MNPEHIVLSANGFPSFNPMQEKFLKSGWKEKSVVVAAPTASGKTVCAELCALNSILLHKKKVVYTCPLRALASEHFNDFKKKYAKQHGIKFTISTGDFDSSGKYLQNYDLVFSTYEKLDSLLRHDASWLSQIGLLVVDEIHELDSGRGPTLEILLTKMRLINPKLKVLALSATIPNAKELAQWLEADLVESSFRPVKLREGVYFNEKIHFPKEKEEITHFKDALHSLAKDTLEKKGKQALIFANTRKRAEGIAKQLSVLSEKFLNSVEKKLLEKKALEIESALEQPTEQCRSLSFLVKKGVAFHHAGLMHKQRGIVEELFKGNFLKFLSATPTLASGVNLPAFRVIIPSLNRFSEAGNERIPVREYKQQVGRAGRPAYDTVGEGIVIARNELELEELFQNFIEAEPENIESKLGVEPVLRTHLLAAVASNFVFDLDSLEKFFSKTFYAFQFGHLESLFSGMVSLLEELRDYGFVDFDGKKVKATQLGRRVSELYLDPVSAHAIIEALKKAGMQQSPFYLFMLCNALEFAPWPSVPKAKQPEVWEQLQEASEQLPIVVEREMFEDPNLLKKFFSSRLLSDWVEEISEDILAKDFGVQPGVMHAKLDRVDWLAFSAFELARLLNLKHHLPTLSLLRKRLKKGVREELVPLCELRGIGRVRARRLFKANIRSVSEVKKADAKVLAKLLGAGTALQLKKQLGQTASLTKKDKMELQREERAGQSSLDEFS
ncbi:MAG: DEAD/DEAH box helicase [Candidatus Diapherotrites archaeon]